MTTSIEVRWSQIDVSLFMSRANVKEHFVWLKEFYRCGTEMSRCSIEIILRNVSNIFYSFSHPNYNFTNLSISKSTCKFKFPVNAMIETFLVVSTGCFVIDIFHFQIQLCRRKKNLSPSFHQLGHVQSKFEDLVPASGALIRCVSWFQIYSNLKFDIVICDLNRNWNSYFMLEINRVSSYQRW